LLHRLGRNGCLGFGKAARTRTQLSKPPQSSVLPANSAAHTTTQKPAATINCCDSIAVPSSSPSGLSIMQCRPGLGVRCECGLLGQIAEFTSQLAALESWLQFQHRSDRQTTQRFQGALQNLDPRGQTSVCHCRSSIGEECPFSCMNWEIALAIYLFS